jgi:chromosome segregation ATPase
VIAAPAAGQATGWLPVVAGLIVAVLGGGGLVALIKARPERSLISVNAAQGAVIVQSGVIDSLRADLNAARAEIRELRGHMIEIQALRDQVRGLEAENGSLRSRVAHLESQLQGRP